jgi:hypothetical protein
MENLSAIPFGILSAMIRDSTSCWRSSRRMISISNGKYSDLPKRTTERRRLFGAHEKFLDYSVGRSV